VEHGAGGLLPTGYHRALEVAKLTAETYLDRIWGEHDLWGRRLYLSVRSPAEIFDATENEPCGPDPQPGRLGLELMGRVFRPPVVS
jgi:hypothetical protein